MNEIALAHDAIDALPASAERVYKESTVVVETISALEKQPFIETISADLRAMRESAQKSLDASEQMLAAWKRYSDKVNRRPSDNIEVSM